MDTKYERINYSYYIQIIGIIRPNEPYRIANLSRETKVELAFQLTNLSVYKCIMEAPQYRH